VLCRARVLECYALACERSSGCRNLGAGCSSCFWRQVGKRPRTRYAHQQSANTELTCRHTRKITELTCRHTRKPPCSLPSPFPDSPSILPSLPHTRTHQSYSRAGISKSSGKAGFATDSRTELFRVSTLHPVAEALYGGEGSEGEVESRSRVCLPACTVLYLYYPIFYLQSFTCHHLACTAPNVFVSSSYYLNFNT
jgi:hypothetical protein